MSANDRRDFDDAWDCLENRAAAARAMSDQVLFIGKRLATIPDAILTSEDRQDVNVKTLAKRIEGLLERGSFMVAFNAARQATCRSIIPKYKTEAARLVADTIATVYHEHTFEATMSVLDCCIKHSLTIKHPLELLLFGAEHGNDHGGAPRYLERIAGLVPPDSASHELAFGRCRPEIYARVTRALMAAHTPARAVQEPRMGL